MPARAPLQLRNASNSFRFRGDRATASRDQREPRKIAGGTGSNVGAARGTAIAMHIGVRFRDRLMSAAAIVVLMALIALTDVRVRERIGGVTPHAVSHTVTEGTSQAQWATLSVRTVVMENGPLALMVVVGAVLFVCMLRT